MRTITYRFKRWRKHAVWGTIASTTLGLSQIVLFWHGMSATEAEGLEAIVEAMPFSLLAPPLFLIALLGLATCVKPGGRRREYLRLDDDGLTYGNIYRAHRWPWAELSAFSLIRRSNKGLAITFAVPGEPGVLLNQLDGKAMIEDVYDTPLEDMVARLNNFRDRALAVAGVGAGGASQAQQS